MGNSERRRFGEMRREELVGDGASVRQSWLV